MSGVNEIRVGLEQFSRALMQRPERVLDAFVALCDDYDNTLVRISLVPLGTPEGVALAAELQGRAKAMQTVLNEIYDTVTSQEEEGKEEDTENGNGN